MKSNFLKAAEITHEAILRYWVGYTPWDVLTWQEAAAFFNVLNFENGEHKIMAMLLLHWIIEDLPEQ